MTSCILSHDGCWPERKARGLCKRCYHQTCWRIRSGKTTWAKEERAGGALPAGAIATLSADARFWRKVEKSESGCWLWTGGTMRRGYGSFWDGTTTVQAHRYSYEQYNGPIQSALDVCHTCDTPACVRPSHLFLGTRTENMQDAKQKGRLAEACDGSRNGNSKLHEADVRAIREHAARGASRRDLAWAYGVTKPSIDKIVTGKTWRHA